MLPCGTVVFMPRRPRVNLAGQAYHVINRAVARDAVFLKDEDYAAFEKVLADVHQRLPMRIISYCLMPNHWHLVLWPAADGDLSEFMRLVTVTHTQRWHAHYHSSGTGPVYQGRFKSFPIQRDEHLVKVVRYVERNALRAGKVERAEDWPWGSLSKREGERESGQACPWLLPLNQWPVDRPANWVRTVNAVESTKELAAIRRSLKHGRPYGSDAWETRTAKAIGLPARLRPPGRPRKKPKE